MTSTSGTSAQRSPTVQSGSFWFSVLFNSPYMTRWNIQSIYTTDQIADVVASPVAHGWVWNEPSSIRNSPVNPAVDGSATDDSVAIKNTAVNAGMTPIRPPKSLMA